MITHGHEDHIGALSYVLKDLNFPIYATKLTMGIIENKLKEHNLLRSTRRKVVRHGQSINLGQFRIEFIKTNHSIADASALAIYSPAGIVVHTGDFKVDYTPVFGDAIDLQRFAELGKKGVLALMSDSTNAERPGFTMSERTVGKTFDHIFAEHRNTRIIIATFASNVDRVQQIINSAYKYDRKVVVEGRSMVNIIETASELGYLNIPDKTLITIDQLKNYPDEKTVLITTGSQGESMAALSRMAADIQGYDIDKAVIKAARENAREAGVEHLIHFQERAVKDLRHPKKYGFIITNPPYGERLEEKKDLPQLYGEFGESFRKLDSWSAYMITSYEDTEKYFGRKADKNRKIYNGMLKTYFYQFLGPKPPKKQKEDTNE